MFVLGPIHVYKIYTCKHFASWSKYTHVSKSIFTLRSRANNVNISILKDTRTCCTADMYKLYVICALVLHLGCLRTKEQSNERRPDAVKRPMVQNKGNCIKELKFMNCSETDTICLFWNSLSNTFL